MQATRLIIVPSKPSLAIRLHRAFKLTNANWPKIEEDLYNNSTQRIEKLLDCPNLKSALIARNLLDRLVLPTIQQGNLTLLEWIGPKDIDLNVIIQDKTLLQWALDPRPWGRMKEREVIALWLIDNGARIDRGCAAETPLYQTVSERRNDIAERLLARGANSNDCGPKGVSVLRVALENRDHEMVKSLLKHGANPDDRGTYGASALQVAMMDSKYHIARTMLEYSVDPDVDSIHSLASDSGNVGTSCSLLHMTIVHGDFRATRILLETIAKYSKEQQRRIVNQVCRGYRSSDMSVVDQPTSPALLLFPEELCDPKYAQNSTPILSAVKTEASLDIIQTLLDMGADPGLPDSTPCLPIHYAIANGQQEVACALTAGYKEHEICNSEGSTPLHQSIEKGLRLVTAALLDAGANRTIADVSGHNCLHLAVISHDSELIMRLLHEGSDPNIANHNGETALAIAMRCYLTNLRASIDRCGNIREASTSKLTAIEALLTHGAQIPANLKFASYLRRRWDDNKANLASLECRGSELCFLEKITRLDTIVKKMLESDRQIQKAVKDAERNRMIGFMKGLDRERQDRYEFLFEESKDPWGE